MEKFITYVTVIVLIYLAQLLFKVSATRKDGTFSFKELINGAIDYGIYFLGILVFFYAGSLIPEEHIITIADRQYTITDALTMIAYTLIVIQSIKAFKNIKDTFEIAEDVIQTNDHDASFIDVNG